MNELLIGPALGAVVGLALALTGAGGGILAVPLLVFGMHLTMAQAAPVGLIAVGGSSALGALVGLRQGIVRYRAATVIGLAGMLLAPLGVVLAGRIPNPPLILAFGVILLWVAARMAGQAHAPVPSVPDAAPPAHLRCRLSSADGRLKWTLPCAATMSGIGATSGLLSGLLGVGGGFVIVPAMTRYTDIPARSIVATSQAVIALVSIGAIAAAAVRGSIAWEIGLPFAAGATVALLLGQRVAARLQPVHLRASFATVSVVVALLMFARGFGWLSS